MPEYIPLKHYSDDRGTLVPIEFEGLPFIPKRVFYVIDVPPYGERGNHAHKEGEQILVCVKGKIDVQMMSADGGTHVYELLPGECLYVDKMIWTKEYFQQHGSVLMVLCSHAYDVNDYITDFDEFKRLSA